MMRALALLLPLSLGACAALNLNPVQQQNLQLWVQAGKTVVQASATIYCEYEPTTSKIIQVFDTSNNTAKNLAKLDSATVTLCNVALSKGAVVTPEN